MKTGDVLGPYELVSALGAGGMGEVWKARDTRLDRFVAIKTSKEAFSDRFLKEARTIAKLDHPHICRLYDVGPDYLVMELLDGKPLTGPLPLQAAMKYAGQICSALHEAHRLGIVHRDLKPANIMVTKNGISLLDFGLAKVEAFLGDDDKTIIETTRPGQIVGTLHYMSPEQLQGKDVDARSDIFSLGLVLFEMLTGKRAVTGNDPASVISQIILGQTPQFDLPAEKLPAGLDALVHRCLEKKPEDRWQSVRDIEWVLGSIQAAPQAAPAAIQEATKRGWKTLAPMTASLVLVAALGAAGGWWWLKTRPADIPEWRVRPLTAYAGLESMPALSPDGRLVAFVWNGDHQDNFDIYVRPISDETLPLRVTSDAAADSSPAWSPDGDRLAFLRAAGDAVKVIVASSHGGGERTIATLLAARTDIESNVSWSPDGRFLAVASGSILRINIETRETKELTGKTPPSEFDAMPKYSEDGSEIAFVRGPYSASRRLFVQKLDSQGGPSGEPRPLTTSAQGLMGVAWWPERKSLLTAEGFPGSFMEGVIVPVKGGERRYLPLDGTSVMYPTYNLAAKRLVFQHKWLDINLHRGSLKSPQEPLRPAVASSHLDIGVDVSPDGQQIVFVSSRTGRIAIWRADRDGSNQIQLASSADESLGSPRWMPDGKNIILDGGRAGVSSLYVVSSEGGIPSKVPGKGQFVKPFVSPDGKWIYYTNSATGRREVYRMPFGGGEQKQLTLEGGTDAMTSKDGSVVFYFRDGDIRKIPSQGGTETTITTGAKRGRWTVAGDMIYVIRDRGGRAVVAEISPDGGKERIVLETDLTPEGQTTASGLAVSPLTGEIFIQRQARMESDLMIVEGFR